MKTIFKAIIKLNAKAFTLAVCLSLIACSITPQSLEARALREIGATDGCKLIKVDEITNASFGAYPEICKERAFSEMKNQVAQLGANAYRYQFVDISPCLAGGTTISYEAFICPNK